jgi:hypothetical protein
VILAFIYKSYVKHEGLVVVVDVSTVLAGQSLRFIDGHGSAFKSPDAVFVEVVVHALELSRKRLHEKIV